MVSSLVNQPLPLTYPPRNKALWSGLINHWFPVMRPYWTLISEGGTLGGGRLTSHKFLQKSIRKKMSYLFTLPRPRKTDLKTLNVLVCRSKCNDNSVVFQFPQKSLLIFGGHDGCFSNKIYWYLLNWSSCCPDFVRPYVQHQPNIPLLLSKDLCNIKDSSWPFWDGENVTLLIGCWWPPSKIWKGHGLNHLVLQVVLKVGPDSFRRSRLCWCLIRPTKIRIRFS